MRTEVKIPHHKSH